MPILGAIGCIGLIAYLPPTSWLRFAAWLNVGMIIYVRYGRFHSRLTGRGPGDRDPSYMVDTAYDGAWLALAGTAFLVVARIADVWRTGEGLAAGRIFENSWWLTVPFLMNLVLLYPPILSRVFRAQGASLDAALQERARRTLFVAGGLAVVTLVYLLLVVIVR